ncbi:protein-L-isoaspartate O-methyltransferase family protein [Yinghuangia sp. YIM S09857]|uniref:protein-L-isoaspartate O-methyltransferase family protein n=1 Tax=Yinghuangia sp. YIM S09857 TaxID=3436929 RepID=UPI003F534BA6
MPGVDQVVTVGVGPVPAEQARANLARAGGPVAVVIGDGTKGRPGGAPYDLVHVTAGTRTIALAWLAQSRPGGRIVAPWAPTTPLMTPWWPSPSTTPTAPAGRSRWRRRS